MEDRPESPFSWAVDVSASSTVRTNPTIMIRVELVELELVTIVVLVVAID
jgi:hypothetical protein